MTPFGVVRLAAFRISEQRSLSLIHSFFGFLNMRGPRHAPNNTIAPAHWRAGALLFVLVGPGGFEPPTLAYSGKMALRFKERGIDERPK